MPTLAEALANQTREGDLYLREEGGRLRCYACGHRCPIPDGRSGVCKVRFNRGGRLLVPWGYVGGVALRPHREEAVLPRLPGRPARTASGCSGCDLHCGYCQNWVTSQALRDSAPRLAFADVAPAAIVRRRGRAAPRPSSAPTTSR